MSARHRGHIKLAREFFGGHPFWHEPRAYSRAEAWIDLIVQASWADRVILVRGERVRLERGEVLASIRFLAERWRWSKDRATRFVRFLLDDGALTGRPARTGGKDKDKDSLGTIYLLTNYDAYQSKGGRTKDSGKDSERDSDKDSTKDSGKDSDKDKEEAVRRSSEKKQWRRQGEKHASHSPSSSSIPLWIHQAQEIFAAHGDVEIEELAKHLAPAGKRYPVDQILRALRWYVTDCEERDQFKTLKNFREHLGAFIKEASYYPDSLPRITA